MSASRSFTPHSRNGWLAVALGFGVVVVLPPLYLVSNAVTDGGSQAGPAWLAIVILGVVLALAVPAVVLGVRARRADPSVLGPIALVVAGVIGAWAAFAGLVGLFV